MRKISLFLLLAMLLQWPFLSSAAGINEDGQTFQLPAKSVGTSSTLPLYRIYNSGTKVSISTTVPIAGLQLETTGSWNLGTVLVPSGWSARENNGKVLVYNLSNKVLTGKVDLFSYSGSLSIVKNIAADRLGKKINQFPNQLPPENIREVNIDLEQVEVYRDFFSKASSVVLPNKSATSTTVIASQLISGPGPGQTDFVYRISMDNFNSDVVGIQFTLQDLPNWLQVSSVDSQLTGFDAYVNDHDGMAEAMIINLSGLSMPTGGSIPLLDLHLNVDAAAQLGQTVNISFYDLMVSNSLGQSLPADGLSGFINIGTKGDINIDGQVDILDVVLAINFALDIETPTANQLWLADMNNDSQINILDVVNIINTIFVPVPDSLTVTLATDTPASGLAVSGASRVPFTKLILKTGSQPVTIDSMLVQRGGTGQDAPFASIEILDGDTMLPFDPIPKILNSSHQAIFNQDIVIPANTNKSVYLVGTMISSLASYAGETPSLGLVSIAVLGATPVSVSLPIYGNTQTLNGTITIGSLTVSAGADNPSPATIGIGTNDYIVNSFRLTAGSVENVTVNTMVFTNNGSSLPANVANIELVNSNTGQIVCSKPTISSSSFVCSNLGININAGQSVTLNLRLDIVGGSSSYISYDINQQGDILAVGNTYGYNILPTYPNASLPFFNSNNTIIGIGSLRIEPAAVSPTDISAGSQNITLGKFKFVATGESVNITSIGWNFTVATSHANNRISDYTNIRVYDPSGNVVAGPTDILSSGYRYISDGIGKMTATTTDTIIVPVGETIYTVKADLSNNFNTGDTIQAGIQAAPIMARGNTSGFTITVTPASNVQSTNLTVRMPSLLASVSANPPAQTIVAGVQDLIVANYILNASNSGSDIKVTAIKPKLLTTGSAFPALVSGWTLWDGSTQIPISSESTICSLASCSVAATNSTTTLNLALDTLVIPAGQTKVITVKVDINTGATSGTLRVGLQGGGLTALDNNNQTVNPSITGGDGQAMTLTSTGVLDVAIASDPISADVIANTIVDVGRFTLQPRYEGAIINSLGFTIQNPDGGIVGNSNDLQNLYLYDGATLLGSVAVYGTYATLTPSGMSLAMDQEKTYTIKALFSELTPTSVAKSGQGIRVSLSNINAVGSGSGANTINNGIGAPFNTFTMFKSLPTVAQINFDGNDLIVGNDVVTLKKFSVTAGSSGPVGLWKFTFGVTTTTVRLNGAGYYLYESDSADSLGSLLARGNDFSIVSDSYGNKSVVSAYFDVNDDSAAGPIGEHRVLGAGVTKYYTLRGTILYGHDGTADNEMISTVLAGDPVFAATYQQNAGYVDYTPQHDFIWSDLNFYLYSTTTATNNIGWFNGFRVPGLDSTSSTPQAVMD